MDQVKDAANKAASAVDKGLQSASESAKSTIAQLASSTDEAYESGQRWLESTKATASSYWGMFNEEQDKAFGVLKGGIEYCIVNPMVGYPLAATTLLVVLPGFRRGLYRWTLGRLRNPEAVVSTSEQKIGGLQDKLQEYTQEYSKLQSRANVAYEEYNRGYNKLKAARQELQRLEGAVLKTQRVAENVITDLRSVRNMPRATELRAEAAERLQSLKQQRATLQKEISWIVAKDI